MKRILKFLCVICLMTATALPAIADVSCKNLFDINHLRASDGSGTQLEYSVNGNSITIPSNTGAAVYTYTNYFIPAGTYVFTWQSSYSSMYIVIGYNDANGSIQTGATWNQLDSAAMRMQTSKMGYSRLGHTSVITSNVPFKIGFAPAASNSAVVSNVQLEKGSTATSYAPYNALCATCEGTVREYESATGTGVQDGTPTPTNPITPTFYQQGNMVLRKVGNYADSYDSTTGKITRRVGVRVLNGTEDWTKFRNSYYSPFTMTTVGAQNRPLLSTHFANIPSVWDTTQSGISATSTNGGQHIYVQPMLDTITNADTFKQWLADQYAAGTPVTVYYPLATAVEEDWAETSYCATSIKIATTKYTEDAFANLVTTLNSAITKVTNIVDTTVQQATEIGNLATTKQDRPDTDCPAGRKCLLIMGADNKPHWYLIQE